MQVSDVPGCDDVYLIDTMLAETPEFCASFFLDYDRRMLVDTGTATTADTILDALDGLGVDPSTIEYIVVSHLHIDHAGGAAKLADHCENATILCHPITSSYLTDETKLDSLVESTREVVEGTMAASYDVSGVIPPERIQRVTGGERIDLGTATVRVLSAPGHAPHQIALFDEATEALFLIDEGAAHFHGHSMANASPPNFDLEKTIRSLERFTALEPSTVLYCHFGADHGGASTLEADILVVESWVAEVESAWEQYGDEDAVIDTILSKRSDSIDRPAVREALTMHVRGSLQYIRQRDTE